MATINTPGYLPEDDDPPVFDTASEAWWHLYHERCYHEWEYVDLPTEGHDHRSSTLCPICSEEEDSETGDELGYMAVNGASVGTVYGPTPGYLGDHDLGIAYCVMEVDEA